MLVDVGKEYRAKVNAFNASSFYGNQDAKIIQAQQDRTETRSQGGLNYTAREPAYWAIDNPHRSVQGDIDYLKGTSLWNTKYKETTVNQLQYIQAPQYGYNKNYWVEHLNEIERNRVGNVVPSQVGNGNMTLELDTNA
jgi:hypothetical protein